MYVPSYVPEPIEIPDNVAEQPRATMLRFVKRVSILHLISLALIVAVSRLPIPEHPLLASVGMLLAVLLGLSLIRGLVKGRPSEQRWSAALAPMLIISCAGLARLLEGQDVPIWALPLGPLAACAYILASGRDLSFLGMYLLALLTSSASIFGIAELGGRGHLWLAIGINGSYLFYFVYDLAAILTRRHVGEEWGAVLDLYRDLLNVFTYPIRVWRHWQKHRLWSP